jgi:hypothetical protein
MSESLGARLRQRREEQNIPLSAIVEQTKIKLSWLEALERDDVSRWPTGIFGRAFVRAYAHAIGLQPDVVVREFLDQHPGLFDAEPAVEAAADAAPEAAGPPTRFRDLVGAAVGSLSRLRPGTGQRPTAHGDDSAPAHSGAPDLPVVPGPSEEPVPVLAVSVTGVEAPLTSDPDLLAAAHLCTEFGRLGDTRDAAALLPELARLLDAVGLIVWVWDPQAAALMPTLPCGYSDAVLAQLPNLPRDADNATAASFRSGLMSVVSGRNDASDALVVPLMAPAGCAGVLAIELPHGGARRDAVKALATIFAAQMARLVAAAPPAAAASRRLA